MAMLEHTLSWAQTAALNPNTPLCHDCGLPLDQTLARLRPIRCRDCHTGTRHDAPPLSMHVPHRPRLRVLALRRAA